MRRRNKISVLIIPAILMIQSLTKPLLAQEYDSNALPREQRMEWWEQARFGMFIHWGLYSIPAGIWNGEKIEELGEWIMAYADITVNKYEQLAKQFNPEEFNAGEWVRMAKDAGMKYLIITTRHHDGFCLFDTEYTDWNIMDATPFKRDIIRELSDECRKAGITFCAYYSILEWHHPAMELNTDFEDLEPFSDQAHDGGPFTNIDSTWRKYGNVRVAEGKKGEFIRYMKAQLKELVDNYHPGIIWFDGGWVDWWTPEDGKEILQYLWSLDPELIVNNRAAEDFDLDVWYGDYGTPEQTIPLEGLNYRWETCMTMNSTWGYKSWDHNWKSPQLLITQLVDIIAKGGNFLLNVGPTAEGSFTPETMERLREVGDWIKINGESVYGTENWKVYKEGRHDLKEELYDTPDVSSVQLPFTARDIRFTRKGDTLYATCLGWPGEELLIRSLGKGKSPELTVKTVSMLGSGEKILWEQTRRGLKVSVPKAKPCNYAYVYKVLFIEN